MFQRDYLFFYGSKQKNRQLRIEQIIQMIYNKKNEQININSYLSLSVKSICEALLLQKWENLTTLKIGQKYICEQLIDLIISKLIFPNLRTLEIYGESGYYRSDQKNWEQIKKGLLKIKYGKWDNLTHLFLGFNYLDNKQLKNVFIIKQSLPTPFQNLMLLNLNNNFIGFEGIRYLVNFKLRGLRQLNLDNNILQNQGIKQLIKSEWPHLRTLRLCSNRIKRQGFQILISNNWNNLRFLYLHQKIDFASIFQLMRNQWPHFYINCLNQYWNSKTYQPWGTIRNQITNKFQDPYMKEKRRRKK